MMMHVKRRLPIGAAALLVALLAVSCRTTPVPRAPSRPGPTRIALVSDTHVNHGASQVLHSNRLARAIAAVNAAQVDFALIAGDLTENGTPSELAEFRRQIRALGVPVWFVPGNHDVGNKRLKGAKTEVGFGRVSAFEVECGRSWWARELAGVRVIGVNSALFGSKLPQEKRMWNFLEAELEKPGRVPTLLLLHHPPFVEKRDEPGGAYWNLEPYPRARLLALAKQGGVRAVLSGHLHRHVRNEADGMVLWTAAPIAFGLPKDKRQEGWTLLTVSGKEFKAEFQPLEGR